MAGLTANGLVIRTQPELVAKLNAALAAAFPGINLDEGPEHQFVNLLAEELAIAWETLQAIYGAAFGNGDGLLLDLFSAITGTLRRSATKSRTPIGGATVNLNAGVTLPAGKVVAVLGVPDAQFQTVAAVTNSGGAATDIPVILEAVKAGPVPAPAVTLTQIVTPFPGWNSVTNSADAIKGRLVADDVELNATRIVELAARGSKSYGAIRAAVAKVANVLSVFVIGNETSVPVGSRPPKSFETLVWDNGAAVDNDVAQAIYDKKPAGIQAYGTTNATAKDEALADFVLGFTRVALLRSYVACTIVLANGADPTGTQAQVKTVLQAKGSTYIVAQKAYESQLRQAILDAVAGVTAVTALTVDTIPVPVASSVTPTYSQIVRIASADVTTTIGAP